MILATGACLRLGDPVGWTVWRRRIVSLWPASHQGTMPGGALATLPAQRVLSGLPSLHAPSTVLLVDAYEVL